MKILLVHPSARFSIADVANGYGAAFRRAGHVVQDYFLHRRMGYHVQALSVAPESVRGDASIVSRFASETVVVEAMVHQVDLVVIVSGMNLHPVAPWLLDRAGIPTAVIMTESPYDDAQQVEWASASSSIFITTNDRFSAERHGWLYLPPSYDPIVHRPVTPSADVCDALFVGTGWGERQRFLEAVDWTGINLRLHGLFPDMQDTSPIAPYYRHGCLDNETLPPMYAAATVCLNFHRRHPYGWTPNPRVFELAAIGAFQVSDPRPDVVEVFGDSVPTFSTPEELASLIHRAKAEPAWRQQCIDEARVRVAPHTFDARVTTLLEALTARARVSS